MKKGKRTETVKRVRKVSPLVKLLEKWGFLVAIVAAGLVMIPIVNNHFKVLGTKVATGNSTCTTIQSGELLSSTGEVIETGYDKWGYNYQAHLFNGYADNYSRPAVPVTSGDKLNMKWSDAWLANVDCNGDGKLDRGLVDGVVSGTSMGWLTNQYNGSYIDTDGKAQKYTDFYKIVWVGPGGDLWGQYHVIQEVYNDTGSGNYRFKDGAPGFGLNEKWTMIP